MLYDACVWNWNSFTRKKPCVSSALRCFHIKVGRRMWHATWRRIYGNLWKLSYRIGVTRSLCHVRSCFVLRPDWTYPYFSMWLPFRSVSPDFTPKLVSQVNMFFFFFFTKTFRGMAYSYHLPLITFNVLPWCETDLRTIHIRICPGPSLDHFHTKVTRRTSQEVSGKWHMAKRFQTMVTDDLYHSVHKMGSSKIYDVIVIPS